MAFKSKVQYKIDPKTGKVLDTKWGNGEWESKQGCFDGGLAIAVVIALIIAGIIAGIASLF